MRVADTLPHPNMKITIYTLDRWWNVEAEAGPMKQGYKFDKEQFPGTDVLKQQLAEHDFLTAMYHQFENMYKGFKPVSGR